MTQTPPKEAQKHQKLARLPKGHKISKRPLARSAIPSKYASSDAQKLIYISTRTPFMSAVKRVQTLLRHVEARGAQSATDLSRAATATNPRKRKAEALDPAVAASRLAARRVQERARGVSEEVAVRASGRAIERALGVGRWFEEKEGYRIAVRTGSVRTVDDIEKVEGEEPIERAEDEMDVDGELEEVPEARIRHVSYVEIAVALA